MSLTIQEEYTDMLTSQSEAHKEADLHTNQKQAPKQAKNKSPVTSIRNAESIPGLILPLPYIQRNEGPKLTHQLSDWEKATSMKHNKINRNAS